MNLKPDREQLGPRVTKAVGSIYQGYYFWRLGVGHTATGWAGAWWLGICTIGVARIRGECGSVATQASRH